MDNKTGRLMVMFTRFFGECNQKSWRPSIPDGEIADDAQNRAQTGQTAFPGQEMALEGPAHIVAAVAWPGEAVNETTTGMQ